MKKIFTLIVVFTYVFPTSLFSQAKTTSDGKELIYNISIGAVFGALGSIINKKKNENTGKIIIKGLGQGALGGYLTFESKRLVRFSEEKNDWKLIWAAKLLNAGGTSIKENAALNQDFWGRWHINIGFNRIEFETKDKFAVRYKIMPVALVYTIGAAVQTKFEIKKSLKNGQFIFSSNSSLFDKNKSIAATYPGIIILNNKNVDNASVIPHETIHIFQANDFSVLETYLQKPLNKINAKSNILNKINKYVYYDFRYIPFLILDNIEYKNAYYYYDNLFEREAGYFSNTFNAYILK